MKKLLALFAAFALVMTLTACGGEAKLPADGEITMENIDEYMGRDNVQYVDLRNNDDLLRDGFVQGFGNIPYFDYIEVEGIAPGRADITVGDKARLEQLFDKDAEAIFLMCASGGRAGWVKKALESIDYTNVYNVGGFKDYSGTNKVAGDGSYTWALGVYGDYTPGVHVGEYEGYLATVVINANGGIENVAFDAITCTETAQDSGVYSSCTTKQTLGEAYGMKNAAHTTSEYFWYEQANMLADAIVAAQGWSADWTVTDNTMDDVAGVTVKVTGFKMAFEDALGLGQ